MCSIVLQKSWLLLVSSQAASRRKSLTSFDRESFFCDYVSANLKPKYMWPENYTVGFGMSGYQKITELAD